MFISAIIIKVLREYYIYIKKLTKHIRGENLTEISKLKRERGIKEIRRIKVLPFAVFSGVFYAISMLIFWILWILILGSLIVIVGSKIDVMNDIMNVITDYLSYGVIAVIISIIVSFIAGFVGGLIIAGLYNITALIVGGIKIEARNK